MPKVSVVIPNYNHAKYLARRIESVLDQTLQDLEIIFLDDASNDESLDVFSTYTRDPRIRCFLSSVNSGSPFKQWNKGVQEATGEYIWIAESDDYADRGFAERLIGLLDADREIGLAYCQSWVVDENDLILGLWKQITCPVDEERWTRDYINDGRNECGKFLSRGNTIPNASAVIIRRDLYDAVGGANENLRLCGDWLLWVNLLMVSKVAFVAEPLNYFRQHPNTVRESIGKARTGLSENYQVTLSLARYGRQLRDSSPEVNDYICQAVLQRWRELYLFTRAELPKESLTVIFRLLRELGFNIKVKQLSELYAGLTFAGYAERDFAIVRKSLPRAILYDQSWLLNRGILSIAAQAFLGQILRRNRLSSWRGTRHS